MSEVNAAQFDRVRRGALTVAVAALVLLVIGAIFDLDALFQAYLVGWLYWWGIALGSAAIVMIHHLTGGRWGEAIGGVLEAALRTIPIVAALFIPLLFGLGRLYSWMGHADELGSKAAYLNLPFFIVRALVYFALWAGGALLLARWAEHRRRSDDPYDSTRLSRLSAPGLIIYFLTVTFAGIDWIMSLEAHWFSSIFGLLVAIGQMLASLSLSIVVLILAGRAAPALMSTDTLHDLGKLLLAAVTLWAYIAFSQFLIIWYGNLPEEIVWYVPRIRGGWGVVAFTLIVLHFAIPLAVLLSRQSKRQPQIMLVVAGGLLVMHMVDVLWTVVPSFGREACWPVLLDIAAVLGIGGVWMFFFLAALQRHGVSFAQKGAASAHG